MEEGEENWLEKSRQTHTIVFHYSIFVSIITSIQCLSRLLHHPPPHVSFAHPKGAVRVWRGEAALGKKFTQPYFIGNVLMA